MTVICVDDHSIIPSGFMENVSQVLPGEVIVSFKNAEDALCYNNENWRDVLISKIELCGTDGLTLAKKIKMINSKVNIIFFTVCDEKEHAKEVMKSKPSGYLVKPAKKSSLKRS